MQSRLNKHLLELAFNNYLIPRSVAKKYFISVEVEKESFRRKGIIVIAMECAVESALNLIAKKFVTIHSHKRLFI